jgi:archaellum component FlaC
MGSLSDRSQQQSSLLREQEAIIEHLQQKIAKLEGSLEALNKEIANHLSNLQRLDNIIKDK